MNYSLSGKDLLNNSGKDCKVMTYPQLINYKNIDDLFKDGIKCVYMLYLSTLSYGHWILLIKYKDSYEHFNSYGGKPDATLSHINIHFRKENNMYYPLLSYLYYKSKKPVHYNTYQLQKISPKVTTCGRWCLLRYYMHNYMDVDKMSNMFKKVKNKDKLIVELTRFI